MTQWTDAQMEIFTHAYQQEITDSRLAHRVVPEFPMPASARSVASDVFDYESGAVDDVTQIPLEERQELFRLTRAQAEDSDLTSAQVIVRRAAQRLSRGDDERVFRTGIRDAIEEGKGKDNYQKVAQVERVSDVADNLTGEGLVAATAGAVFALDTDGYRSGYAMVAGPLLYRLLHTRAIGAADLPIVAVRGLMGDGPVHRCTVLPEDEALVLSVGAGRIDRAVAVAAVAEFLRNEPADGALDELRLWRLYERYITRFKETRSAVLLRLQPQPEGEKK
ncbi:encapsulin [Pseudarthrobacter sulfonivorans]|uniref:encapsulin n=1 Tax=Pseudarthrobacter sulfonivorans TaxID=121292 RepID=UPI00285D704D|nr:encapsulin [Pseudarthrobacter sulfonivorans]MDR6413491.1 hypothetical protein [Pseudarthrobacter sulfonivorans]